LRNVLLPTWKLIFRDSNRRGVRPLRKGFGGNCEGGKSGVSQVEVQRSQFLSCREKGAFVTKKLEKKGWSETKTPQKKKEAGWEREEREKVKTMHHSHETKSTLESPNSRELRSTKIGKKSDTKGRFKKRLQNNIRVARARGHALTITAVAFFSRLASVRMRMNWGRQQGKVGLAERKGLLRTRGEAR